MDEIVDVANSYVIKIKVGDKICFGSYGADFAVHPEHRGKGISRTARNMRDEQKVEKRVDIELGLTENPIPLERNKRHRYPNFPHGLATYALIFDLEKQLRLKTLRIRHLKIGYLFFNKLKMLRNIGSKKKRSYGPRTGKI